MTADATPALAVQYARLDDETWIALANRGLLRRARKDLAADPPALIGVDGDAVVIGSSGQVVRLDDGGPVTAVCDCPATGICRHIITAGLWLAEQAPDPETIDNPTSDTATIAPEGTDAEGIDPERIGSGKLATAALDTATTAASGLDDLLRLDRAALLAHAGRDGYRWARDRAVALDEQRLTVLPDGLVRIELPNPAVTLHFPGGALSAMVPTGPVGNPARIQVCAVLSVQRAVGVTVGDPGPLEPTPAERRRLTARREMYAALRRLLLDTVALGTTHVSQALVDRYAAAAITAQAGDHFRLAAALRRLAYHFGAVLDRTAGAGEEQVPTELATTLALLTALEADDDPPERLLGSGRTGYSDVGDLRLVGFGAYPWRTASGYLGITALFWDLDGRRFLTYTDTRPENVGAFDPVEQYRRNDPVWPGLPTLATATGVRFTLHAAKTNEAGRLSRATQTHAVVTDEPAGGLTAAQFAAALDGLPVPVTDWSHLAAAGDGPALLDPPVPNADWTLLSPEAFGVPYFDEIGQILYRPVVDIRGAELLLRLPYTDLSDHAVRRLEGVDPAPGTLVVGRRTRRDGVETLLPLSLIDPAPERANPVDALHFDPPTAGARGPRSRPSRSAAAPTAVAAGPLDRFADWLIRAMERGTTGREAVVSDELGEQVERLRRAGFSLFPVEHRPAVPAAEALLRSYALVLQLRRVTAG